MIRLIESQCVSEMGRMRAQGERFHLIYCDPPFCSGRVYRTADGEQAFDDRWPGVVAYAHVIALAARFARDLLTDDGCLVVHLDPRTSHYVKVELDSVFGATCFASEIVWRYRRWPSKTLNFQRVHDVLLRYVKDPKVEPRWNQLYEPLASSTLATWGDRKQRAITNATGQRVRSSKTAEKTPGVPMGDVWDIGIVAPVSKERTGYPCQKPEALLERLILACTHPGDRILDPYAGSGSTLAAAARLGRDAVGIDSSPVAIRYACKRLGLIADSAACMEAAQ